MRGNRIFGTTFVGTQQANDGVVESFETSDCNLGEALPLGCVTLRWDAAANQWQKAQLILFQRMIYYARVRNVNGPADTKASLYLYNYTTGLFNLIGNVVSLPVNTWIGMVPEVSNPSAYVDASGNMRVQFVAQVFSTTRLVQIDIDELAIRFTAN